MTAAQTPQRWHADDVQTASLNDPAQCAMFVGDWLCGVSRCEGPGSHTVRQACVHEHVHDYKVCAWCAERLQASDSFCNECTDSAESHECKVSITVLAVAS